MSDTTIRPAALADLPGMIELARRSWLSAFAQTAPLALIDWWCRSRRTQHLYELSWPEMHVLCDGGDLVGLVHPRDDEINGLWVHPARQGQGFGARLLRHGEGLIREAGHSAAWLTCSALNERALAFYRAQGYAETSRETIDHECGVEFEDVRLERGFD